MDTYKAKILLVEDDESLGLVVRDYLSLSGYDCILKEDGESAWNTFQTLKFDLCVFDIMLPRMDGFSLAEKVRGINAQVPILFLTSKQSKEDRILGFKTGADDYITKPFNIEELVLRIEVFLRRSMNKPSAEKKYHLGKYIFDYQNLTLHIGTTEYPLSQKEADILQTFCLNPEGIVKRDELLNAIWGSDDYFKGRSLDVFISKLRKHLKDDPSIEIQNLYSVGFRLRIEG
ncbi:MAG: DNA-binding response regulator [Bacteroidales bacterium]|nr:MAG: DNA-binding response regulator [Bacteroidales bacterium]